MRSGKPRLTNGLVVLLAAVYLSGCAPRRDGPDDISAPESLLKSREGDASVYVANMDAKATDDWPCLFGPTHDCVVPRPPLRTDWGAAGPPELWRRQVGTGYSSPIVVSGRLIVLHREADEEIVLCCDARTGITVWEYRYPSSFRCEVNYTSGPYSTPASDGERVYTIGAEGRMHCLQITTGQVLWEKDLKTQFDAPLRLYGTGHSPLIWGDRLYVNVGGNAKQTGIVCFDKHSGNMVWSATDDAASYATPRIARIHDQDCLFVLTHQHAVALNPHDGSEWWRIPLNIRIVDAENAVSPLVYQDIVAFASYGNGTVCSRILPGGSKEELWFSRRALTTQYTPMVCIGGYAYGFHCGDHSYRCIELASGELVWRDKGKLKRSMVGVTGNAMILFDENGRLAAMEIAPTQFKLLSMSQPLFGGEKCFASPAFSGLRIYLRSERELLCLDLKRGPLFR